MTPGIRSANALLDWTLDCMFAAISAHEELSRLADLVCMPL
jgi:hypothetical protein